MSNITDWGRDSFVSITATRASSRRTCSRMCTRCCTTRRTGSGMRLTCGGSFRGCFSRRILRGGPARVGSFWTRANRQLLTPHDRGVNGGGKVGHVGGSIVGLRLSTFRENVRLSDQQKCHLLIRDRIRCRCRQGYRRPVRRGTFSIDVSSYGVSVDAQLPYHLANGHALELGLLHRVPPGLLQKRRPPR